MSHPLRSSGYEMFYFTLLDTLSTVDSDREFSLPMGNSKKANSTRMRWYSFLKCRRHEYEASGDVAGEARCIAAGKFGFYLDGENLVIRDKNKSLAGLTNMLLAVLSNTPASIALDEKINRPADAFENFLTSSARHSSTPQATVDSELSPLPVDSDIPKNPMDD